MEQAKQQYVEFARRFVENGVEGAINRKKQQNRHHKITGEVEAHMIAIACSDTPEGRDIGLFSRRVITYKISKKNSTQLITATFKMAHEEHKPPSGLIFHSDRGAQYTSHRFQQILREHHTKQSFSQPGKPHDNAVAESFFASPKKEELYRKDLSFQ